MMKLNRLLSIYLKMGMTDNGLIRLNVEVQGFRIRLLDGNCSLLNGVVGRQSRYKPARKADGYPQ